MKRNEFLHYKNLVDEIADLVYKSRGKQGYSYAREILRLVNIAALKIFKQNKKSKQTKKQQ